MKVQEFIKVDSNKFNILDRFFTRYESRDVNTLTTVVLHWTGGTTLTSAVDTLRNRRLGYHFLIEKDGTITQGCPINKRVGHAGFSYGPNGKNVNKYSIGISFTILDDKDNFTDEMYTSCINLISDLKKSIPNINFVTGHHWISPGRKVDPYTLDFDRIKNNLDFDINIWKTGFSPFPENLTDCKCIEKDSDNNCVKSIGKCNGSGGYKYSERDLSTVISDLSFNSDLETE